ncbi:hypothetical protein GCM10010495_47500 [Kitasatospora herbaricolor]|nr:hypothetical protein [Kitasatospora herbaricolor]GGV26119.1 hypothetical protein GCM10010495_47500 [Kitasatospora herbaricolor]
MTRPDRHHRRFTPNHPHVRTTPGNDPAQDLLGPPAPAESPACERPARKAPPRGHARCADRNDAPGRPGRARR